VALRWLSGKLQRVARYRLVRRQWSRFKRRFLANGLVLTYRVERHVRVFAKRLFADLFQHLATVLGVMIAGAFVLAADDTFFQSATFSAANFHLASAGIMGTALALVLSLSIVPAQKAADVFSSAILQLYAQDRVLWRVFAWLASLTLASVLLGTDWTFGLDPRWTIALQFILLGIALDQLRTFYLRALELLSPQTALGLVREHCNQLLKVMVRDAKRVTRIFQVAGGESGALEPSAAQWLAFQNSPATQHLIGWIHQLEEFAHKAVAKRDTHAATAALTTMSAIGIHYAEVRRDSIVLVPEFAGYMPVGVSDIAGVLNPIYESKNVCQDAARQPDEAVVIACIRELGRMAAHFMTIVHTRDGFWATAPLAYGPIFYIKVCATEATRAKMDDASLAAVRAIRPVYEKKSPKRFRPWRRRPPRWIAFLRSH
jgi:hypothetical protein